MDFHTFQNMCPLGLVDLLELFGTYSVLVVHFYLYLKMHENEDESLCVYAIHIDVYLRAYLLEKCKYVTGVHIC